MVSFIKGTKVLNLIANIEKIGTEGLKVYDCNNANGKIFYTDDWTELLNFDQRLWTGQVVNLISKLYL